MLQTRSTRRTDSNRAARRAGGLTAAVAVAAGLLVAVAPVASADPTPPPNPTDGQLSGSKAQAAAQAERVGRTSALVAEKQEALNTARNRAAVAEQKVALAVSRYRDAQADAAAARDAAAAAKTKLDAADARVESERTRFTRYMQAIYQGGDPSGLTGTLLTADDPSALLQQSTLESYEVDNRAGAIGSMQRATVAQSNAEAGSRREQRKAERAEDVAAQRQQDAIDAQEAAAIAVQDSESQTAAAQTEYDQAVAAHDAAYRQYLIYKGQRATYDAYVAEQRRLAEIRRQKRLEEQRRRAEAERQKALAAQRMRENRAERAAARREGRTPPPVYHPARRSSPAAPRGGGWSAAKARQAVQRAKSTLGMPYAWAGGGPGGPSYGACVPSAGAPNDCNVYGYDCSGLAMFAWGKGWDHYADTQFSQAGSFHPSQSNLRPGDLVFFGYRGGGSDLHHVAIYIGNGRIIEAPYSGGYVQYNSLYAYSDYYGATRPLT